MLGRVFSGVPVVLSVILVASVLIAAPSNAAAHRAKVIKDPRGDVEAGRHATRAFKRAGDIVRVRYSVREGRFSARWTVVDLGKAADRPRLPIYEIEGVFGRRHFTVDVRTSDRAYVKYWVGPNDRRCNGARAWTAYQKDRVGFSMPIRCLPRGRTAKLMTFTTTEYGPWVDDDTRPRKVKFRIR
jgi:hypothetical protein